MVTGMTLEKKTPMDRIKEITGQLETGIAEIFTSEKYTKWLNTMSRFHNYSLNNTVLISMQKPDATLVAGYTAWKNRFGRQVKKGEKAIRILAPAPYKKKVEVERIDSSVIMGAKVGSLENTGFSLILSDFSKPQTP